VSEKPVELSASPRWTGLGRRSIVRLLCAALRAGTPADASDWPTIPQVYVKGEFVGGCDIMISSMSSLGGQRS
jgi:monothiol glutaredoxin